MMRMLLILLGVGLAGCAPVTTISPSSSDSVISSTTPAPSVAPEDGIKMTTCGDVGGEAFPVAVWQGVGPPPGDDDAADVFRRHIAREGPTRVGWIEAVRTDDSVLFIAPDEDARYDAMLGEYPSHPSVRVEKSDGRRRIDGTGGCEAWAAVDATVRLAVFRVAPGEELAADSTDIAVLVTEIFGCHGGRDVSGRILPPQVFSDAESVTVLMTVRPLPPGNYTCQDSVPAPFVLRLPEPLGGRTLLDGSSIPPRDATIGSGR